jgi:CspA family cold shock protein
MAKGKIKWFDAVKGYGFIKPDDDGPDIFLHLSKVQEANLHHLQSGVPVAYSVERQGSKLSAKDLSLVSADLDAKLASREASSASDDFADKFEKEWGLRQA